MDLNGLIFDFAGGKSADCVDDAVEPEMWGLPPCGWPMARKGLRRRRGFDPKGSGGDAEPPMKPRGTRPGEDQGLHMTT